MHLFHFIARPVSRGYAVRAGLDYWVGRNSFGTRWGEGPAGGWFRLQRGSNTLNLEANPCAWATPAANDVAALNKRRPGAGGD